MPQTFSTTSIGGKSGPISYPYKICKKAMPINNKYVFATFQVEEKSERTLKTTQEKVDFRTLTLADKTGEMGLSMWRKFASIDVKVGCFYKIANVKTSIYNNTVTLNNTYNTRIEVSYILKKIIYIG